MLESANSRSGLIRVASPTMPEIRLAYGQDCAKAAISERVECLLAVVFRDVGSSHCLSRTILQTGIPTFLALSMRLA